MSGVSAKLELYRYSSFPLPVSEHCPRKLLKSSVEMCEFWCFLDQQKTTLLVPAISHYVQLYTSDPGDKVGFKLANLRGFAAG